MQVGGVRVQVVRKPIKNLHLGVYPPNGRVRVAAPLAVSNDAVRLAVVDKLGWVNRQRRKFENQPRQSARRMVSGESHYFLGRTFRLRLVKGRANREFVRRSRSFLDLGVPPAAGVGERRLVLDRWYREQLRAIAEPLFEKWQDILAVRMTSWSIKKMKTKWGACNAATGRIWLNVDLVKAPHECIEYLVVHELVHLMVSRHDSRFHALMSRHLPNWKSRRDLLNAQPLPHAVWPC